MRALRYCVGEATASLWRGRRSGALSIVTNAAAMFVLGALLLAIGNIEQLIARWTTAAEMSVYLDHDVSVEVRAAIARVLDEDPAVASHEYLPQTQALGQFRREFADLADVIDEFAENPLPASFEVRLRPQPGQSSALDALANRLREAVGVADVRYDRQWIERVMAAAALVQSVGGLVVVILIVAAALTVANVVRLAGHVRRDELAIMQLVGAPLAYVRGPFVVEGMLQGGAGAALALGALWLAFTYGQAQYGGIVADLLGVSTVRFLAPALCGLLVAGGVLVGCVGGLLGARSQPGSGSAPTPVEGVAR